MRNWDSCMFPCSPCTAPVTTHAGKVQRVRQRFMHKLKYYVDKYENGIQCVGCGRCVNHCPVNIDIRKVCGLMNRRKHLPVPWREAKGGDRGQSVSALSGPYR
jgi:sulfhydrogenase subunit beta (sulfur reductase)